MTNRRSGKGREGRGETEEGGGKNKEKDGKGIGRRGRRRERHKKQRNYFGNTDKRQGICIMLMGKMTRTKRKRTMTLNRSVHFTSSFLPLELLLRNGEYEWAG